MLVDSTTEYSGKRFLQCPVGSIQHDCRTFGIFGKDVPADGIVFLNTFQQKRCKRGDIGLSTFIDIGNQRFGAFSREAFNQVREAGLFAATVVCHQCRFQNITSNRITVAAAVKQVPPAADAQKFAFVSHKTRRARSANQTGTVPRRKLATDQIGCIRMYVNMCARQVLLKTAPEFL